MYISSLISAKRLQDKIDKGKDLIILDCRASLTEVDAGYLAWQKGHLPNSLFFDLHSDMSNKVTSQGRFPLPLKESFTNCLQSLGVSPTREVILLDDAGGMRAATRAWWLLYVWAGHPTVKILDGGLSAWLSNGGQLKNSAAIANIERGAKVNEDWFPKYKNNQLISAKELLTSSDIRITDSRPFERFTGQYEPLDAVAGHIPGANCRPIALNLTTNGFFKSPSQLNQELALTPSDVVYCGGGVAACHTIFCYHIAGLPLPKLYIGSWSHWIIDKSRPITRCNVD